MQKRRSVWKIWKHFSPSGVRASSLKIISRSFGLETPTSIGCNILDLEGFSPFARAGCAWLHILDQTLQTEVHTENQLHRYPGSGQIELTRTQRRTTETGVSQSWDHRDKSLSLEAAIFVSLISELNWQSYTVQYQKGWKSNQFLCPI